MIRMIETNTLWRDKATGNTFKIVSVSGEHVTARNGNERFCGSAYSFRERFDWIEGQERTEMATQANRREKERA